VQRPLDPLGFKQSRYERPEQEWICGRAAEGRACPLGPDKRGNCRATGECTPIRKGDRWFCTRADSDGGKCEEGPLPNGKCSHPIPPCQPVPSLRRRRGAAVWTMVALTAGALLLLLGGASRRTWVSPGELTNAHATSASRCSACHSLDLANHPAVAAFHSFKQRALADSALCLKCHSVGDHPLNPHGVASASLVTLRQGLLKNSGSAKGPLLLRVSRKVAGLDAHSGNLACLTCHQEHRGRSFDLERLSNAQCQACHSVQFASFRQGHPEFSQYPYRRRTRIFFDHYSHLRTHFPANKDKAPHSCQDCHFADPSGRFMQVKRFEVSCGACHGAQIRGAGMTVKGIAFFTVPGLDVETLNAKGVSVGDWPKFADGKVTPFMELLLNREPATRKALQELRGVDLLDLRKAAPGQIAAAEQLAWGVKNLLFNLIVEGQGYLLKQIGSQMPSDGNVASPALAGEISPSVLVAAQKEWMPNLFSEVTNYHKGIKPALPVHTRSTPQPSATPPPQKPAEEGESLLGGGNSGSGGELLAGSPTPAPTASKNEDLTGGELLVPRAGSPTPTPTASKNEDLTGGELLVPSAGSQTPAPAATPSTLSTPPPVEPKPAEEWVEAGGWYRPKESFTIFYRPSGHADKFLVAWLTVAAQLAGSDSEPPDVFQQIADPQAPGVCMKCHTADRTENRITINWLPAHAEPNAHPFTVFKHTAHFSLMGDQGCQRCHALNPDSTYSKYFTTDVSSPKRDPHRFQSNFRPLSKELCAECHRPRVAGDGCLMCHQYHVGTFVAKLAGGGKIQAGPAKPDAK
jgi:hypothetical protein